MPITNGGGSSGGNSSVWWKVRHTEGGTPVVPVLANECKGWWSGHEVKQKDVERPLTRNEVKIDRGIEGYAGPDFVNIGKPDHPGFFRVVLRFKPALIDKCKDSPTSTSKMLELFGKKRADLKGYDTNEFPDPDDGSLYLEIDVPAVHRSKQPDPAKGERWADMPWEVTWGW